MNFVDREVKLNTENYTDGRGFTRFRVSAVGAL